MKAGSFADARAWGIAAVAALLVGALAPSLAFAQAPEATPRSFSSRVEPDDVELGRPFSYLIEVRHAPDERYLLPSPLALGTLTVRAAKGETRAEGDVAVTTFRIEAAVFDQLGELALPSIVLSVETPAGARQLTIPGPPLTIREVSKGAQLPDLQPAQALLVRSYRLPLVLGGLLISAAIAYLLFRRFRRRQRASPGPAPDLRTPQERALEALAELARLELPTTGRAREHYFRLSEIARTYLQETSGIAALDMTTRELLDALERHEVPGLELAVVVPWIERGDLVKFARADLGAAQAAEDLEAAERLVRALAEAQAEHEARAAQAEG